jgi:hypothetical protein
VNRNQKMLATLVLAFVATTSAILSGVLMGVFDNGIALTFLAGAETGILVLLLSARSSKRNRRNGRTPDPESVVARLIGKGASRSAAFHWNTAAVIVQLALSMGGRPPRSARELMERLRLQALLDGHSADALDGIDRSDVNRVRMHLKAIYAHCGGALDHEGPWPPDVKSIDLGAMGSRGLFRLFSELL